MSTLDPSVDDGRERRRDMHLQTAIARLEGKIDSLTSMHTQLRESMAAFDGRLRALELEVATAEGQAAQASRAPQWPAVVSAVVAAAAVLLALLAVVYQRPPGGG